MKQQAWFGMVTSDETVTAWSRMSEKRVEGVAVFCQAVRLESREKGSASMANSVQQSGDGAKKGKLAVLFEDLSIAQVIAGALAAATVFLRLRYRRCRLFDRRGGWLDRIGCFVSGI